MQEEDSLECRVRSEKRCVRIIASRSRARHHDRSKQAGLVFFFECKRTDGRSWKGAGTGREKMRAQLACVRRPGARQGVPLFRAPQQIRIVHSLSNDPLPTLQANTLTIPTTTPTAPTTEVKTAVRDEKPSEPEAAELEAEAEGAPEDEAEEEDPASLTDEGIFPSLRIESIS